MNSSHPLLDVRELTIRIGERTLVRDLSLEVHAGEVWCILGANGVGKSMFFNTLVGLRCAESGTIRFAGKPSQQWSTVEAARLRGFLPQAIRDTFSAPVLDVVMMGRHPHMARWSWEDEADHHTVLAALNAVGLASMADRDIATLSGGERQRAAIATLLAQETLLLLLDEPVAQLDLHYQISVLRYLASLAHDRKRAVIFSVHDLNLASRFASHAMLFREDGSVDRGPIAEVMNDTALSLAFRCPVAGITVGQRTIFVPA